MTLRTHFLKKSLFVSLFSMMPIISLAAPATPQHWELNPDRTKVGFQLNYFGNAKAVGTFNKTKGALYYDTHQSDKTAIRFEVYTNSIDTGWRSRDSLLRGKSFFDSAAHPTMTFESTQVSFTNANTGTITGNLTLHGMTKPITLDITLDNMVTNTLTEKPAIAFVATGIINRDEYGMTTYTSAIANQVAIKINGELNYIASDTSDRKMASETQNIL